MAYCPCGRPRFSLSDQRWTSEIGKFISTVILIWYQATISDLCVTQDSLCLHSQESKSRRWCEKEEKRWGCEEKCRCRDPQHCLCNPVLEPLQDSSFLGKMLPLGFSFYLQWKRGLSKLPGWLGPVVAPVLKIICSRLHKWHISEAARNWGLFSVTAKRP